MLNLEVATFATHQTCPVDNSLTHRNFFFLPSATMSRSRASERRLLDIGQSFEMTIDRVSTLWRGGASERALELTNEMCGQTVGVSTVTLSPWTLAAYIEPGFRDLCHTSRKYMALKNFDSPSNTISVQDYIGDNILLQHGLEVSCRQQ